MTAKDIGRFFHHLILIATLLGVNACDLKAGSSDKSFRKAQTEHIDLHDEVKRVLPKGTLIYYANIYRDPYARIDHWYVKSLDIHSGIIRTILSGDESKFSQMLPFSITHDGRFLLVDARKPQSDRRILLELDTHTHKWRKVAEDIFSGDYSPDDSKIAVYYPVDPARFHLNPIKSLRVGIIDRNGNFLRKIKCESQRCSHPNWSENKDQILFIDESRPEKLKIYKINTNTSQTIFSAPSNSHTLSYPAQCNGQIIMIQRIKQTSTIPSKKNNNATLLFLNENRNANILNSINDQRIVKATCIPTIQNYLVTTMRGKIKNGAPTDLLHLELFNLKTRNSYRLTPGPTLETTALSPVVYIPQ